jgi:hypothetical protein
MNWDTIQQLVRILMQLVAGFLVQRGLITEDMVTGLVGAVVSLAGIGWWMFWDRTRPVTEDPLKL